MVAARVMAGATLAELREEGLLRPPASGHIAVKEAVLPFDRFPDIDTLLGPEMRSTGEVMGIDSTFGTAFAKAQLAAGDRLPSSGQVLFSLADRDKAAGLPVAVRFADLGFLLAATAGTANYFQDNGVPVSLIVAKVDESGREDASGGADVVELIKARSIDLVINTPHGRGPRADGVRIRTACTVHSVPCLTTVAAARAAAAGIAETAGRLFGVRTLQQYHADSQGTLL
jgi:carbamoyl-phosphate synthase large subunit